jgi:hypothetical protein
MEGRLREHCSCIVCVYLCQGCSFQDHEVLCGDSSQFKNKSLAINHPSVLDAVVRYRDLVCPKQSAAELASSGEIALNVFRRDEEACSLPVAEV